MKIGFNGRFILKPYTGIGQYSINLLMAMATQAPEIEWVVGVPEMPSSKSMPDFPDSIRFLVVPERRGLSAALRMWWWEQVQLPRALQKSAPALIHYPYPSNPRFRATWNLKKNKTIVTVHDLIPWTRPEYRSRLRSRLYQDNAKCALNKADHVIAVSQTTGSELTDTIHFPSSRISVIHEAASKQFRHDGAHHVHKKPYLIYVGGYDPRKNVTRLIEAFEEYVAPHHNIDLLLVGATTAMEELAQGANRLLEAIPGRIIKHQQSGNHPSKGAVIPLSALTPEKLAEHYRGAIGFINVSLAEGFNLPLLEAAASHLPILTSNLPIHQEIIGEYGSFCDPKSTKSIGEMILNFLRDTELQERLKQNAASLSDEYTWDNAAAATLALYQKMV